MIRKPNFEFFKCAIIKKKLHLNCGALSANTTIVGTYVKYEKTNL